MKNLYPFVILFICCLFFSVPLWSQSPGLQATYTASESRCRATGAITVNAWGGSGSYNYKVVGPVSTPFTSSSTITGLEAGTYTLIVQDVVQNKELQLEGVIVSGSYADPRFMLQATDVTCAGNDGSISVNGQQFGRSPFTYTIIAPSPAGVGTTSTAGTFTGLLAGEYSIRLTDSCGGIQVRTVRIEAYDWGFESSSITRYGCDEGDVVITLKDNKGNTNTSGTAFNGFRYGVVQSPGDTLWGSLRSFRFALGKRRGVVLVAKDRCNKIVASSTFIANGTKPAIDNSVSLTNRACSTFSAAATNPKNLTSPEFCVYNSSNVRVACNAIGVFNNLPYGSYTMQVRDLCYDTTIVRSFSAAAAVPSVNSTVDVSNTTCSDFTATVKGATNFTNPKYCIYNSSNVEIECNVDGIFKNVPYGTYTIKVTDACSNATVAVTVNASRPVPVINGVNYSSMTCSTFTVKSGSTSNLQSNPQFCLYDNNGNLKECNSTGEFTGLPYGRYCMQVKTSCGDVSESTCFTVGAPAPNVDANVSVSNKACSTYTATITGKSNLTNPQFCIFNSGNEQVACNTTGVFNNLPYGAYTIKITDGCNGTVITRTVTASRPAPALDANIAVSNTSCATFTATVNGSNLTSPVYSVYDTYGKLLATSASNTFTNLPYGRYCFKVKDGCTNDIIEKCHTVSNPLSISVTTARTCALNTTDMQVVFTGSGSPYRVQVYHPDGSMVREATSTTTTVDLKGLPGLPAGTSYRVVGTNNCGQGDEKTVVPNALVLTRSAVVQQKCPSALSQNGSGDLTVTCSSNHALVTPKIISKDGAAFNRSYSTNTGNNFVFAALAPGTYVVQYTIAGCDAKEEQTVVVAPYTFPSQDRSAIYQCNDNGFSLGASVKGGVGPYQYEIIGSLPESPSIVTAPQNSAVFSINNGTIYSLVRLRSVDACGNATLNDISVLPLQNIAVSASQTCLYQDVTLAVDAIPNAVYKWYLKQSEEDSVLVNTNPEFTIPFLVPEKTGVYVCHVSVNNDCITRFATFDLNGKCDDQTLPVAVQLRGRRNSNTEVQLTWDAVSEQDVLWYGVERKLQQSASFQLIDTVKSRKSEGKQAYTYLDKNAGAGKVQYRVRITVKGGKRKYSNVIQTGTPSAEMRVLPNPARSFLRIYWKGPLQDAYQLELYNAVGQRVHSLRVDQPGEQEYTYLRPGFITPGLYLLHCTNSITGERQIFKVVFE